MSEKKEYIERGALMEFAKKNIGGVIYQRDIDRFPAADVEPVVRGRWKTHIHTLFVFGTDNETYTYECGNCHCVEEEESIRCPHCGAHMMERSASGE